MRVGILKIQVLGHFTRRVPKTLSGLRGEAELQGVINAKDGGVCGYDKAHGIIFLQTSLKT